MRDLSSNAINTLATTHGIEPIMIVEINWAGKAMLYAERTVLTIPGKIISISELDDAVNIGGNSDSQELTVTLDDTDGAIKAILDQHDVHKRPAKVYQYFAGLELADKFILFSGKINTPVVWNERDRTVTLTILAQLEDREIGFSAEEGGFTYLPADMVNKTWPLIFGTVVNNPCLEISTAITGTTLTPVGILAGQALMDDLPTSSDVDFEISIAKANVRLQHLAKVCRAWGWTPTSSTNIALIHNIEAGLVRMPTTPGIMYLQQYVDLYDELVSAVSEYNARQECTRLRRAKKIEDANTNGLGSNPMRILGGEDFPQHQTVTIEIEGGEFTGVFDGQEFTITSRSNAELIAKAQGAYNSKLVDQDVCPTNTVLRNHWYFSDPVPCGQGDFWTPCQISTEVWTTTYVNPEVYTVSDPIIQQFWVEPGAQATLHTSDTKTYIVSITPGTVLSVRAYKQLSSGQKRLVDVPSNLYTVSTATYGTITAVQLKLAKPLSHILDGGWDEDIYVTFHSTVGPNVADIMQYIVEHYTDLSCDAASFAHVKACLTKFPANFAINDRKNVVETLREIAFQARCAIWFADGVVYLQYLPEEPTAVDTITESDIDADSGIVVELTPTEDLVTKMVVNWSLRVATDDRPFSITLRHNLKKYGTHEQTYDFYIFNQPDIIYKMATFWLVRKSNTWKRIRFTTPLHKLKLETFDCVTLSFSRNYVSNEAVKAVIESATYNSDKNAIDFVCLVPVTAGTMALNPYYWPAACVNRWPSQSDITQGYAGAGGLGASASGRLPVGNTAGIPTGSAIYIGGQNVVFGPHADWGDRTLADTGFVAQNTVSTSDYTGNVVTAKTDLDLTVDYAKPMVAVSDAPVSGEITLDIHKTRVVDSSGSTPVQTYLSDLIARIDGSNHIVLNGEVLIWADGYERPFVYKYDTETDKLGAGAAFLYDDVTPV
jgi:hypothetical protein